MVKDAVYLLDAMVVGRFPNLGRLSLHAAPPNRASQALYSATIHRHLKGCTELTLTTMDYRDDPEAQVFILSAILALPRLRRLTLQRVAIPDAALVRFWRLTTPGPHNADAINSTSDQMGAAAGASAHIESLVLRDCLPLPPRGRPPERGLPAPLPGWTCAATARS